MSLGDALPVSESIGVFVGVSGFDWLTDGQADAAQAAIIAAGVGAAIFVVRLWLQYRRAD